MSNREAERQRMVEQQIVARSITDARVLDAMRLVPRHEFVSVEYASIAYSDHPIPLEQGQTVSQPYIVALMLEAAALTPDAVVLDVGTGSGYAAAVASLIARRVVSIERHPLLAESARERLAAAGYANIEVVTGDGTLGWAAGAPYDAIVAAATGPRVPQAWLRQLTIGGRVVMPIGAPDGAQRLVVHRRDENGLGPETNLGGVTFVPLLGEAGWNVRGPDADLDDDLDDDADGT